jgi:hypothetical protein
MLPNFPEFKKLELFDKTEIEAISSKFPPYSDFNFTSLWIWNGREKTEVSMLNNNLVVKFTDYLSDNCHYSFLGDNNPSDTAEKLLNLSEKEGLSSTLKFVPEISIAKIDKSRFNLSEDKDNSDYILDNESLLHYKGRALHNHANFKKRFVEVHSNYLNIKILDFYKDEHREHATSLHNLWVQNKIFENKDAGTDLESIAIKRIFDLGKNSENFSLLAIFHTGEIIAFCIDELIGNDYAIRHIMKADTKYKGVYSFLVSEAAKILLEQGIKYVNIEQDLGLKNLRQAKKSFNPATFLKKYTVNKSNRQV